MIRAFFGLTQNPFDRREVELLPGQQEILDTLKVHCQQGGLCLVLGVPGTGKSVIKHAVQRLPENQHLVATGDRLFHVANFCRLRSFPSDRDRASTKFASESPSGMRVRRAGVFVQVGSKLAGPE